MGGNRDNGELGMSRVAFADELVTFAVIQIVVGEHEIEVDGRHGASGCGQAWNYRHDVRCKKLPNNLLGEYRVVFEVKNVHS